MLLDARLFHHHFKDSDIPLAIGEGMQNRDMRLAQLPPAGFKAIDHLGGGKRRVQRKDAACPIPQSGAGGRPGLRSDDKRKNARAVLRDRPCAHILCEKHLPGDSPKAYRTDCSARAWRRKSRAPSQRIRGYRWRATRRPPAFSRLVSKSTVSALDEPAAMMFLLEPGIRIIDVKFTSPTPAPKDAPKPSRRANGSGARYPSRAPQSSPPLYPSTGSKSPSR